MRWRLGNTISLGSHTAVESFNDSEDINRAWENIKDNIKISAEESLVLYERKQHKLWFYEVCSELLDERKQAKMRWLQNPNRSNADKINTMRSEASRYFRGKK